MLLQAYPKADFHKLLGQLAFTRCSASCSARPHYQESWRSRVARHDRIPKKGRAACVHTLLGQLLGTTTLPRKLAFTGSSARPHYQERWCSRVAPPVTAHNRKSGVHELLSQSKLTTPMLVFTSCSASWCSRVARPVEAHNPKADFHKLLGQLAFTCCSASCSARPRSRAARHDRITKKGRPACVHTLLGQLLGTTALPRKLAFTGCSARPHYQERWCSRVARLVRAHNRQADVHELLGQSKLTTPRLVFTSCSASWCWHCCIAFGRSARENGSRHAEVANQWALHQKIGPE